jgi:hypothetical protein
MEWFKKHADTIFILGAVAGSVIWMSGKFNDVDKKFSNLEKDMAVMKTVILMKEIAKPEIFATKKE